MTMPLNLTSAESERWAYASGDAQHAYVWAAIADRDDEISKQQVHIWELEDQLADFDG